MNRQEKENVVQNLKKNFTDSKASFLVHVQGMTVPQLQALRAGLREQNAQMHVAKNTLLRIAVKENNELAGLEPYLREQTAIVFSQEASPAVAKVIHESSKDSKLEFVAALFDGEVIQEDKCKMLAKLPAREVIIAQALGALNAPLSSYVGLLNILVVRFLHVLKQIEEQKS